MTADSVTAIAALVVAVIAILISVWEGLTNRRHNRLSVKPFVVIEYNDHVRSPLNLMFHNMGLGPALIDRLEVFLDKDKTHSVPISVYDALFDLGLTEVQGGQCWSPERGDVVAAGKEIPLVVFPDSITDIDERRKLIHGLQKAEFHVTYSSIYGEKFTLVYRVQSRRHPLPP